MFRKFSSQHRSTWCVQISWNLADGKAAKSCVAYLPKKQNFAWLSSYRYGADRAQNLPTMYLKCSRLPPNQFTFAGGIAERVNTGKTRLKVNPIFDWRVRSNFEPNNYIFGKTVKRGSCMHWCIKSQFVDYYCITKVVFFSKSSGRRPSFRWTTSTFQREKYVSVALTWSLQDITLQIRVWKLQ